MQDLVSFCIPELDLLHPLGMDWASRNMIWVKNRDASEQWIIDSRLVTGNANGTLHFNTDAEYTGGTTQFGSHTSTTFGIIERRQHQYKWSSYIAYCFSNVEGYSKVGINTGNGSTDGPFVYCGFKPAWVMAKNVDDTGGRNWGIQDTTRKSTNPVINT